MKDLPSLAVLYIYKIPLYLVFVGGAKGVRYVFIEVLVNPILSDSFGFSEKQTSLFLLVIAVALPVGIILL